MSGAASNTTGNIASQEINQDTSQCSMNRAAPESRIARDPGGNQTRQTGLDDTKSEMAMTAGNAKVHGTFSHRKGRASAVICGAEYGDATFGARDGAGRRHSESQVGQH
jgi:hypothetical protein